MQFSKARKISRPVVVLLSGVNSRNSSVTFKLQSIALMNTSVLSSRAIENALTFLPSQVIVSQHRQPIL